MSVLDFIRDNDITNALARAEAAHQGPKDHHWYDPLWNKRLQRFRTIIEGGETNLARVITFATTMADHRPLEDLETYIWLGKHVEVDHVIVTAQRRALINSSLRHACTPQTDAVVELGSGDGLNLFNFWLAGGPAHARYMALEITNTGRLCTQLLGQLEPSMNMSAHDYDYFHPNYDEIPSGLKHLLVFSSGSIEQIDKLPEEAITGLLGKTDFVTGVHFEPVSWQIPSDQDPIFVDNHRRRCLKNGYNENFWPLMNELEARGAVQITRTIPYVFGRRKHPVAMITWRKTA